MHAIRVPELVCPVHAFPAFCFGDHDDWFTFFGLTSQLPFNAICCDFTTLEGHAETDYRACWEAYTRIDLVMHTTQNRLSDALTSEYLERLRTYVVLMLKSPCNRRVDMVPPIQLRCEGYRREQQEQEGPQAQTQSLQTARV